MSTSVTVKRMEPCSSKEEENDDCTLQKKSKYSCLSSLQVDPMNTFQTAKDMMWDELIAEDFTNHCVPINNTDVKIGDYVVFHKHSVPSVWGKLGGKAALIGRVSKLTTNTIYVRRLGNQAYDSRVFEVVSFPDLGCWIYYWNIGRSINLSKEETRIMINNKVNKTLHKITSNFTTTFMWDASIPETTAMIEMLKH